jgi:hypothetical protein
MRMPTHQARAVQMLALTGCWANRSRMVLTMEVRRFDRGGATSFHSGSVALASTPRLGGATDTIDLLAAHVMAIGARCRSGHLLERAAAYPGPLEPVCARGWGHWPIPSPAVSWC